MRLLTREPGYTGMWALFSASMVLWHVWTGNTLLMGVSVVGAVVLTIEFAIRKRSVQKYGYVPVQRSLRELKLLQFVTRVFLVFTGGMAVVGFVMQDMYIVAGAVFLGFPWLVTHFHVRELVAGEAMHRGA